MKFIECKLADLSLITSAYQICPLPSCGYRKILSVSFNGVCGHGHKSNADVIYLCAIIAAGLQAWQPCALILDLQELSYEWGDMMSMVFGLHSRMNIFGKQISYPSVALISDRNRKGLTSLVKKEMFKNPEDFLFESLGDAIIQIEKQVAKINEIT